jgi:hypothetical protein
LGLFGRGVARSDRGGHYVDLVRRGAEFSTEREHHDPARS